MTKEAFHALMIDPATPARLSAMVQANQRLDAQLAQDGPRQCCAEFGVVTDCDGNTDQMFCGICDRRWSRSRAVGDGVPAVEA